MIGANAGGLVHRMGVAALEQDVFFGAHHEEGGREREDVESLEIDVAAIHHVEGAGLGDDLVEDIDVVHLAIGDADKRGDIAVQVEQGVHLDGGFVLPELRPREQRQTQIDGRGIQRVEAVVEIHTDGIGGIEGPRDADQHVREVGEDAPVMRLVGVGQRRTRHLSTEAQVIQLGTQSTKACLDIAQALAISQLSKSHCQILVPAREAAQAGGAIVTSYATTKFPIRQEADQLREHRATLVHRPLSIASRPAIEPAAIQIAARHKSSQETEIASVTGSCKALCRTLVISAIRQHGRRLRQRQYWQQE